MRFSPELWHPHRKRDRSERECDGARQLSAWPRKGAGKWTMLSYVKGCLKEVQDWWTLICGLVHWPVKLQGPVTPRNPVLNQRFSVWGSFAAWPWGVWQCLETLSLSQVARPCWQLASRGRGPSPCAGQPFQWRVTCPQMPAVLRLGDCGKPVYTWDVQEWNELILMKFWVKEQNLFLVKYQTARSPGFVTFLSIASHEPVVWKS